MQKSKMAVRGGLTKIAVKRREVKSKGEKERYKHLNAEFQRIARRDEDLRVEVFVCVVVVCVCVCVCVCV